MQLSEAITLYLGEHKPTTRASYEYILRDMASFIGATRPVSSFEPADLIRYSQHYTAKTNPRTSQPIALATVKKYAVTVKAFFSWCVKMRLIPHTPADVLKRPTLPRHIGRDKAVTDEELSAIIHWVKGTRYGITPARNLAIVLFLADTGARAGGLYTLTLNRLHIEEKTALVIEKGDKTRPVIFGDACAEALRSWLSLRPPTDNDYVFVTQEGKQFNRHSLGSLIRRTAHNAGITRAISPHAFRHRKGHQFADARIAPSIAATALGHSSATITLEHYYPSDWTSAADALRSLTQPTDEQAEARETKLIRLDKKSS